MPYYEYGCESCGDFSLWRAMALSSEPARCPCCGTPAPRILSAAPMIRRGAGRTRSAEPQLVQRKEAPPPPPAAHPPSLHGRPWMIGH